MGFQIEKKVEGDQSVLVLSGGIDEDASFEGVGFGEHVSVVLDLEKITAINSCGIREWMKWMKLADEGKQITFRNCPKIIVDQINMVAGFLPSNGVVESFYVPYYCEETGDEKMILFRQGQEFKDGEILAEEELKDEESGCMLEMDVIEAKYFKFLKN